MMKYATKLLFGAAVTIGLAVASAGLAHAADPVHIGETTKGKTLVDAKGMTLYTFGKDSDGKSACNGPCAGNWPPLKADAAGNPGNGYTIIARADGSKQWAYKGKPLYTWVHDTKPGDITGDGFMNGAWHVAQP
jgi:predicted lipoprotein with Yx(FWY)xxD motif